MSVSCEDEGVSILSFQVCTRNAAVRSFKLFTVHIEECCMKVGFIGLGNMGSGIAANLLKAGHEVTVYNRTASKAEPLVKQGAGYATMIAEACRGKP
jgi:glutamyl-tRNA reductase